MFTWTLLERLEPYGVKVPFLPFELNTSQYNSVTGGYTHATFGEFRHDFTLADRVDGVHIFGDLLQFLYSPSEAETNGKKKLVNFGYDLL
ncbi:MAG: hypothetical protein ACKOS8_03475, partial [Gemmataceae bacterium]